MFQVSLENGKSFSCELGQTLLDAAHKAGINLPYSCKTGRCSTCKVKVTSGQTKPLVEELGLADVQHGQSDILACVRTVESDITLDAEDLGDVQIPAARLLPCRVSELNYLSENVLQIRLRTPPAQNFTFLPGQYIDLIGPNGVRRSYSLANCIQLTSELELHIKKVPNGAFSKYWFEQAKVNDLLRLNGPQGTFFLRNCGGKNLVFLATGTGIAPVKAIVESLAFVMPDQLPNSVHVFWGGRTAEDLYWTPESRYGQAPIHFHPVLSRAGADWQGARGYVQNIFLNAGLPLADCMVYACGSENMIHSASQLLISHGLPARQFFSDAFVCSSN